MHHKNTKSGFTLIEMLVALSLGVAIASIIVLVVSSGLKGIRSTKQSERLHANMAAVMDALDYWIKQGDDLIVQVPSTLEVLLPDITIKTFSLIGGAIMLDNAAITTKEVRVTNLYFQKMTQCRERQ